MDMRDDSIFIHAERQPSMSHEAREAVRGSRMRSASRASSRPARGTQNPSRSPALLPSQSAAGRRCAPGSRGRRTSLGAPDMAPVGGRAKRVADIVIASLALILAAPLLALIALAVRLQDAGPVFFVHERIGHRGKPFPCLKVRSMVEDAERVLARHLAENPEAQLEWRADRKLRRDPRITPLGAFLRKTSLDELPQLINVLRGEMSIVGPRPVTAAELELYGEAATHYTAARPGITGLWQISGRNNVSYEQRIEFDSAYVIDWSLVRDFKIVALTVPAVVLSRGTY